MMACRWRCGGGKGALCFGDTKPPNDFESTRLVARIIQFEYVYGPAARTPAFPSRNSRSSPSPPPSRTRSPRGARNVDITVEPHPISPLREARRGIVSFFICTLCRLTLVLALRQPSALPRARSRVAETRWIIGYRARSSRGYFNLSRAIIRVRPPPRARAKDISITRDASRIFISPSQGGVRRPRGRLFHDAASRGVSLRALRC